MSVVYVSTTRVKCYVCLGDNSTWPRNDVSGGHIYVHGVGAYNLDRILQIVSILAGGGRLDPAAQRILTEGRRRREEVLNDQQRIGYEFWHPPDLEKIFAEY